MKTPAATLLAVLTVAGFATSATAEHSMHHVYHHHHKSMKHPDAHLGHRQACIGRSSGTAHHSCGTHTGGPSGGLH